MIKSDCGTVWYSVMEAVELMLSVLETQDAHYWRRIIYNYSRGIRQQERDAPSWMHLVTTKIGRLVYVREDSLMTFLENAAHIEWPYGTRKANYTKKSSIRRSTVAQSELPINVTEDNDDEDSMDANNQESAQQDESQALSASPYAVKIDPNGLVHGYQVSEPRFEAWFGVINGEPQVNLVMNGSRLLLSIEEANTLINTLDFVRDVVKIYQNTQQVAA